MQICIEMGNTSEDFLEVYRPLFESSFLCQVSVFTRDLWKPYLSFFAKLSYLLKINKYPVHFECILWTGQDMDRYYFVLCALAVVTIIAENDIER